MADDDFDEREDDEVGAAGAGGEGAPEPRANPAVEGHEAVEARLLQAALGGRLPHAIILCGPRGIGKATLAYRFARFILAQPDAPADVGLFGAPAPPISLALDPAHPTFRRVAANGHADLLTIERGFDPKRKRLRNEIVIDDTRTIGSFLHLTAAEGGWRVVIIDAADEMNRNAANAVLKILEEPPRRTLLLLVSHNPGRLLPTIRSRCRKFAMSPLPDETVARLIGRYRPDIDPGDATGLATLAQGSIGRALGLADAGGLKTYRELLGLLKDLPRLDVGAAQRMADRLSRGEDDGAYRTFVELMAGWLAAVINRAAGRSADGSRREVVSGENEDAARLARAGNLEQWMEVWEKVTRLFAQADGLNLDRKQVVLAAFTTIGGAVR